MNKLQKEVLIVAQEDTFLLASEVYRKIKKNKKKIRPVILLISPLEEIIYKKKLIKIFNSCEVISCWNGMRKILLKGDATNILKENYQQLYKEVANQICSHPSQLYDFNLRLQYKKFNGDDLLEVMSALSLHLLEVLSAYDNPILIDFSIYDISRTILLNVCREKKMIYKTLIHSRFENYWLITQNLGKDVAKNLIKKTLSKEDLNIAQVKIKNYRTQKKILPFQEQSAVIKKYSLKKTIYLIINIIKRFLIYIKRFSFEFKYIKSNKKLKRYSRSITGGSLITLTNSTLSNLRYLRRLWCNTEKKFVKPNNYIYFPLPNTVENSELRFNGGYLSEKIIIDLIRKDLYQYKLLIKDHRSMVMDRRGIEIKKFKNIYNVEYISEWLNSENITNTKNLIKESALTIVISGTAGLESALLNKPVLILGTPVYAEYFFLKGNRKQSLKDLENELKKNQTKFEGFKIKQSITSSYIASVIKYGFQCDLYDLIKNPKSSSKKNIIKSLIEFML